jgi:riboflavin kinase/FMN adenylyltransferase
MNLPAQFGGVEEATLPAKPLHLAIGMFDGVHLGHRAVINGAVEAARRSGGVAAVMTFWPHPSALFRPEHATKLIQEPATKARVLATLGVDVIITQPFSRALAAIPAEEFLGWLKQKLPSLAAVYVGENFQFGRGRAGDVAVLKTSARSVGVDVISTPRVAKAGEPISSTRIRTLLAGGEIEQANALLGYNYFSEGVVTPGKRLGRSIGFPTLNLAWAPPLQPRLGVYAVRVSGDKSPAPLPAVANYGLRPTVEQTTEPRLEVNVLGACPFGEGDRIVVEWIKFLRAEMKFAGVEALRAQIGRDREIAAAFFASAP